MDQEIKRKKLSQWNLDVKDYAEKSGMTVSESSIKLKGKIEAERKKEIENLEDIKKVLVKKKVYDDVTGRIVQQICWKDYLKLVRETYPDVSYREIFGIAFQGYEELKQK